MENYKVTVGIEATDKYEKARRAFLEAKTAMDALPPQQQEQLVRELAGAEALASVYAVLKKYFG